ncbi:MAG: hypothetical protein E7J02_12080 [Staphylococcus warneri]|nr:hypothetical protein [Streptococcus mitis]MDU4493354.1 hypothetical protein [Staphylococcus warneri]MDU4503717.1 hypothetical protein [Staphylococcus warneri]
MIKKSKELNIETVEMIDSHYFYIHKEPNFFCLETINTESLTKQENILNNIISKVSNNKTLENNIGITTYTSIENNKRVIQIVYSCYSLKVLKEYTANIDLALKEQIIEFINKMNNFN